ncbi:MAG: hypothetical protein HUU55_16020 [Myxococcales bacterium]|nr:hypothetical protein [Myxococcales bacterium]
MAKRGPRPWIVLPHRPIEKLEDNLWVVNGDLPGMPLTRWMTLIRLADGRLVIHGVACVDPQTIAAIENWGKPAFLLVPNAYHRLDIHAWHVRYPNAKVLCPKGARPKVEQVVAVDGDYGALPTDAALRIETIDGTNDAEGVLIVGSGSGYARKTLVFNDVLFNQPHLPEFTGFVLKAIGSTGDARVSRIYRWFVMKNKKALKNQLEHLAAIQGLVRLIPGHGLIVDREPNAVLASVAAKL